MEQHVEARHDFAPVGVGKPVRAGMRRCDGGLQDIRNRKCGAILRARSIRASRFVDKGAIPLRTILVLQQNKFACGIQARRSTGNREAASGRSNPERLLRPRAT